MNVIAVINRKNDIYEKGLEPKGKNLEKEKPTPAISNVRDNNKNQHDDSHGKFVLKHNTNVNFLDLVERDRKFLQLQNAIEAKQALLLNNHRKLKEISKQNGFLENVKNDYSKYNDYIVQQKKDQTQALQLLDVYLKDLVISGKLSKQNIKDSKEEQKKILREIDSIKQSLEEIIDVET